MKELMYMLANAMPIETIIESLGEDCKEYNLIPSDELKQKITMGAHMICLKEAIEKEGGIDKLTKRMAELERADNLLKPSLS
jgi:hypothetical protein